MEMKVGRAHKSDLNDLTYPDSDRRDEDDGVSPHGQHCDDAVTTREHFAA